MTEIKSVLITLLVDILLVPYCFLYCLNLKHAFKDTISKIGFVMSSKSICITNYSMALIIVHKKFLVAFTFNIVFTLTCSLRVH